LKLPGKIDLPWPRLLTVKVLDLKHLFLRQLTIPMCLASWSAPRTGPRPISISSGISSFPHRVSVIVKDCAHKTMIGVNTTRIVTMVTKKQPRKDGLTQHLVDQTMNLHALTPTFNSNPSFRIAVLTL
jgi:hypothetical protein